MSASKNIAYAAAGIGSILGLRYLYGLYQLSKQIVTVIDLSVSRDGFLGLEIDAVVVIKNPSNTKISIKYPFVQFAVRNGETDEVFASSTPENKYIEIPARGVSEQITITVKVAKQAALSAFGSSAVGIFSNLSTPYNLTLKTTTRSGISSMLGLLDFPYSDVQESTLTI